MKLDLAIEFARGVDVFRRSLHGWMINSITERTTGDTMKMRRNNNAFASALAATLFLAGCGDVPEPAAPVSEAGSENGITLISNARIYTIDSSNTVFESGAVAIAPDGTIDGIGESGALDDAYPGANVVDMAGRTLIPGLIDSHAHLYGLAQSFTRANLVGAESKAEVLDRLREFEQTLPEGAWLLGRGWDQNDWPEIVGIGQRADPHAAQIAGHHQVYHVVGIGELCATQPIEGHTLAKILGQ